MWRYEQGTPCPAALAQHTDIFSPPAFVVDKQKPATTTQATNANVIHHVFDDYNENTTRNISKLMRDEFKNARLGLPQKPKRNHAQHVGVFEDGNAAQQETRRSGKEVGGGHGSGMMSGGAIKARRPQKIKLDTLREDGQAAALSNARASMNQEPSRKDNFEDHLHMAEDSYQAEETMHAKSNNDDRRRTIWVPNDDTSVLTIHPGAYDQTLQDDTIGMPCARLAASRSPEPDVTQQGAVVARKSMSVAPRRGPLRSLAPIQSNIIPGDRVKCTIGKENIPPGAAISHDRSKRLHDKSSDSTSLKNSFHPASKPTPASRVSLLAQPTAASQAKTTSIKKRSAPEPKEDVRRTKVLITKDLRPRLSAENKASLRLREDKPTSRLSLDLQADRRAHAQSTAPGIKPRVGTNLSRYPVLPDDLVQPELYEENWLSHQEVSLTQLINSVFEQASSPSLVCHAGGATLRTTMLGCYQDPAIVTLHQRLKASLFYGALSMPKDSKDVPRLREDVGLRRQFLDLFVQSYNLDALQAAAEVIVGRSMTSRPRDAASIAQSLGATGGPTESAKSKELRRFLLTFFVHHEDIIDPVAQQQKHQRSADDQVPRLGSSEWFWQRTVLQTLMIIHVLDSAKTSGVVSDCLFQTSSIRKSSNSILHALSRMLLPWIGDVTRPLGYLSYAASHIQQPLSEYTYKIVNLATDLRNGVLLTRFIELLLYPTQKLQSQADQTLTLSLPSGETLTSIFNVSTPEETHPLSQHLKFPCAARAQKLHNVSIALSALSNAPGSLTTAAISATTAEDIVDGHREKTLSLLWSLVSKWGLTLLVDWDELKRETQRFAQDSLAFNSRLYLARDLDDSSTDPAEDDLPDTAEQAQLLKAWAVAVAAPHGIEISNLTTSFSSGLALNAIVSAYAEFLPVTSTYPAAQLTKTQRGPVNPVAETLRLLGCSAAFVSLFAGAETIPARSTTLSLLGFLASRLLPLARTNRAARTIQRAWRARASRDTVSKRVLLMRVAGECKEIVRVKKEVLSHVILLQRVWRRILDDKKRALDAGVGVFQTVARGWLVRKVLDEKATKRGASSRRVMGGW